MNIVPKQSGWVRATANVVVSLEEMKSICYVDAVIIDDDALFVRMELAARNLCEQFLGRPLLTATGSMYYTYSDIICLMSGTRTLELPGGKLQSIDSIKTTDSAGTVTTVSTDDYEVSIVGERAQVYFINSPFPNGSDKELDALQINVTGGFGDATVSVPQELKQGIEFLIAYWYEHREDQKIGNTITSSAKASWSPWKILRFK